MFRKLFDAIRGLPDRAARSLGTTCAGFVATVFETLAPAPSPVPVRVAARRRGRDPRPTA